MFDAFILAAGFGTRLRPLTHHRPKPLVPVCGVPLIRYTLAHAHHHGLRNVVLNAHHLHEQVAAWAGIHEGVHVSVVTELPDILGTGGGLQAVAGDMAPSFVVLNGDILHDVDLGALLEAMPEGGACMALRPDEQKRYGAVLADESQRVVRLVDLAQAEASGAVRDGTHFTGIHAMSRRSLESLDPGFSCIVRTVYSELVPQRQVAAHAHDGLWLDVGDPAAYLAANRAVLHGDIDHVFDPFRAAAYARSERGEVGRGTGAHIDGAAWIGPGAAVGGATIRESIVGADAVVAEGAELSGCVVWDGVYVGPGSYTDVVFLPDGCWQQEVA